MPQWRKLHVKTVDSVDVNEMPDDFPRLLWVLLPLVLDSKGRAIDDSAWLRSKVFPMRQDVTAERVNQAVEWFATRQMIVRYEVAGRFYFEVPTFAKYQGNTEREAASVIPDPVKQAKKKPREQVATNSRPTHDPVLDWSSLDVDADAEESKKHAGDKPPAPECLPQPDPVLELAEVFEQASGVKRPTPSGKKAKDQVGVTWWHPLREMVKMANGNSAEVLRAAVSQLRAKNLNVSSPQSCLKTFTSLHGAAVTGATASLAAQYRAAGYTDANGNPV